MWGIIGVAVAIAVALAIYEKLRSKPRPEKLMPESLFRVTADADGISVVDPSGQERSASWGALQRLVIRTTDEGPLFADVFWLIEPIDEPPFFFPGGATGEAEFLKAAQAQLPAFDNGQVIEAMSSTSNQEFVVWSGAAAHRGETAS